jgi:ArsR family metal-binding transcriptional regulator
MLLKTYKKNIFRSKCDSKAMKVHCHAELDQDVSEALPYLNAVLGGDSYTMEPPSVTFRASGKLITVHGKLIAINALKDEDEADKIIRWLQREINQAWAKKDTISPSYKVAPKPQLIEVFRRLPKTNCDKCSLPTCMVFAARVTEGAKSPDQ